MLSSLSPEAAALLLEAMRAKALVVLLGGRLHGYCRSPYGGWQFWELGSSELPVFCDETGWCSCSPAGFKQCDHLHVILYGKGSVPFDGKSYWKKKRITVR